MALGDEVLSADEGCGLRRPSGCRVAQTMTETESYANDGESLVEKATTISHISKA